MSSFCVDEEATSSFVCQYLDIPTYYYGPYSVSIACAIAIFSTYIVYVCVDWHFGEHKFNRSEFVKSVSGTNLDYQSLQLRSNVNMQQDYDQTSNYHTMALRKSHQENTAESLLPGCDKVRANTQFSTYDNQVNNVEVNSQHVVGGSSSIQPNNPQTAQSVMSGTSSLAQSCFDNNANSLPRSQHNMVSSFAVHRASKQSVKRRADDILKNNEFQREFEEF